MDIGRWLGPVANLGQGMASYVLTEEGTVVVRSTVSSITIDERNSESIKKQMQSFETKVNDVISNYSTFTVNSVTGEMVGNDIYENIFEMKEYEGEINFKAYGEYEYDKKGDYVIVPEADELYEAGNNDDYINSRSKRLIGTKITLPHDGELKTGNIENKGSTENSFEVSFQDGSYAEYSANVLTENIAELLDSLTYFSQIIGIIGHRKDENIAIKKENA